MSELLGARTHERWSRSLVKTLGYRALMVVVTVAVALFFTEDVDAALNIGIVANVIKTATYYGYERLWSRVTWGTTE